MSGKSYGNSRKKRKPRKPKRGTANPLLRKQNIQHRLEREEDHEEA